MHPQYWSRVVRVSSTNPIPYASDAMVGRCRAFEMIRPYENAALVDTALVNATSVKNDVYLWIYTIHTIKRHIVVI